MKRLSKRAQNMTATSPRETIQGLGTQVKGLLDQLTPMMQDLQNAVPQLNTVMQNIQQLEQQVASMEQAQAKMQQAAQPQGQQQTQQADDARDSDFWKKVKLYLGKGMAGLSDLVGPGQEELAKRELDTENAVAGVRGEAEIPGAIKTSKKNEKSRKEEMLHDDVLHGGEGDGIPESKLNKKELEMGQEVEMEHTNSPELAREIARDHLSEELKDGKNKKDQKYYTKLKQIHEDKCKDSVPAFWRRNLDYGSR